jgi:apolipoprotein N-acyltransferase
LLFAGIALPAGFAPFGYYLVPIAALALLLQLTLAVKPSQAFSYGYLFGLGMFGAGVNWLHISINQFGGISLIGALLITLLLVLFLALYPAIVMYCGRRYFAKSGRAPYLFAVCAMWILSEWARAWIFTGFPWLQIGYAHTDSPLAGLAPVAGVYGTGLAGIISSALLVLLFHTRAGVKYTVTGCLILLWSAAWLLTDIHWTRDTGREISAALVQGAVPQALKWQPDYRQSSFDLYVNLSDPYLGYDLLVWPETALPVLYSAAGDYLDQLHTMAAAADSSLLTGLPVDDIDTGRYFNSAIMLNDDISFYHKRHLVPFGEYLPLRSILGKVLEFLDIPMSDFSSGKAGQPVLMTKRFTAGISICYEATFGNEIIKALPEAELLVNISNDAWFGDSLAPHQHLQMARMRAIETGRYLLRSTNTGITAIIDAKGELVERSGQFTPSVTAGFIPLLQGHTPYSYSGDLPVILLCMLVLILLKGSGHLLKKAKSALPQ